MTGLPVVGIPPSRTLARAGVLGLVLLALGACSESGPGAPAAPDWQLRELASFPDRDGEDDLLFSRPRDVVRTPDTVFAADALPGQAGRIVAIDLEGRPLGELGRVGEGPGEYQAPSALQRLGDTLWAVDQSSGRFIGFVGSEVAGTFSVPLREGRGRAAPHGLTADGYAVVGYRHAVPEILAGMAPSSPIVRMDRGGTIVDTIVDLPWVPEDYWELDGNLGPMPLQQGPLTMLLGDGTKLIEVTRPAWREGTAPAYTVRVIALDGGESYAFDVPYEPVPTDVSYIMDRLPADMPNAAVQLIRARLRDIPYRPPVLAVARSERESDGVWVRRDDPRPGAGPWDVISLERRERIATVWTFPILSILRVADGEIWGAMRSEAGVPILTRSEVNDDATPDGGERP